MRTLTTQLICLALVVLAACYAVWLYPALPELVPTHWNAAGKIDGWGPRSTAAFTVPIMMVVFWVLMAVLPLVSPAKFKVESFRGIWNIVVVLLLTMFAFIHVIMLQAALHPRVDVGRLLIAGICLFLAALGLLMPQVKRNFWMGVRTPWTLASDEVWVATHKLAGWTMGLGGLLGALLALAGVPPMAAFSLIIAAALVPVGYSLWLYKRLEGEGKLRANDVQ